MAGWAGAYVDGWTPHVSKAPFGMAEQLSTPAVLSKFR